MKFQELFTRETLLKVGRRLIAAWEAEGRLIEACTRFEPAKPDERVRRNDFKPR